MLEASSHAASNGLLIHMEHTVLTLSVKKVTPC